MAQALFVIGIYLAIVIGYVMNIVKLISSAVAGADFGLLEVVRLVGLFTPVGPIVGYF